MCARIHLHVPLPAADTHAYPYLYGAFNSITYAYGHSNSKVESHSALPAYSQTAPIAYAYQQDMHY